MIGSSTLEDELATAAAHAGMPVEPPSPGSQAAPPGLDMAQLLAQMEAMQKELNKLKGENMKFRFYSPPMISRSSRSHRDRSNFQ